MCFSLSSQPALTSQNKAVKGIVSKPRTPPRMALNTWGVVNTLRHDAKDWGTVVGLSLTVGIIKNSKVGILKGDSVQGATASVAMHAAAPGGSSYSKPQGVNDAKHLSG